VQPKAQGRKFGSRSLRRRRPGATEELEHFDQATNADQAYLILTGF